MIKSTYLAVFLLSCSGVLAVTANGTVDFNTFIRTLPNNFRGLHDSSHLSYPTWNDHDNDSIGETLRNYTMDVELARQLSLDGTRSDADLDNVCDFEAPDTCIWRTDSTSNYRNINKYMNETNLSVFEYGFKIWTIEATPRDLASNASNCNYGLNGAWPNCEPYSWSALGNVSGDFILRVVGGSGNLTTTFYRKIGIAFENEPYSANFHLPNATCQERIDSIVTGYPQWYNATKAKLGSNVYYISPSFTTENINSCGWNMSIAFIQNFTGTIYEPDYYDFHLYCSSGVTGCLYTEYAAVQTLAESYGVQNKIVVTETNINSLSLTSTNQPLVRADLVATFSKVVRLTNIQQVHPFQASCLGTYALRTRGCFEGTPSNAYLYHAWENYDGGVTLYATYHAMNDTRWWDAGSSVYTTAINDTSVTLTALKTNATRAVVTITNVRNAVLDASFVVNGQSVLSAVNLVNGTAATVSGSLVTLPRLPAYGVTTYELTLNATTCVKTVLLKNGKILIKNGKIVTTTYGVCS